MKRGLIVLLALQPVAAYAQVMDIIEQNITVDLTGADTRIEIQLHAMALMDLPGVSLPKFGLDAIAEVDGFPAELYPNDQYPEWAVDLIPTTTLTQGSTFDLRIVLTGTFQCAVTGQRYVACVRSATESVLPGSEPGNAWYAFNLYESDPFTGRVVVHSPGDQVVVAGQGAAQSIVDELDGSKTWTFAYDTPIEFVGLYSGVTQTATATGAPNVVLLYNDAGAGPEFYEDTARLVSTVLAEHAKALGPLPVDEAHLVSVPAVFNFAGLGMLGTVFVFEDIFGTFDYLLVQGIAHEFAHSWWGNLATASDYAESGFFSESFAELFAWRALGEIQGDDARTSGVRMNSVWYMFARPGNVDVAPLDPNVGGSQGYVFAIYHKASSALRTVEEAVGPEQFGQAMRNFAARGYARLDIPGFVEEVRMVSGYDPTPIIDQWLRRTGFPRFHAASEISTDTAGAHVRVRVTQEGNFTYSLPVRFTLSNGERIERSLAVAPGMSEETYDLVERPVAVELDPRWTSVRVVSPELNGDVTLDGDVDAADLIALALMSGGLLPTQRRVDGKYDPLFDLDANRRIETADLEAARDAAPDRFVR